jgi:hypothetical protein
MGTFLLSESKNGIKKWRWRILRQITAWARDKTAGERSWLVDH